MKIKSNIEFLTFNDGTVRIFRTDDNDRLTAGERDFLFGNRAVGVTRYYAARQNDIELNRVIHIHRCTDVTTEDAAVIGDTRYRIVQVQQEKDSNPPCTVLSLEQRGLWEGKVYETD